MTSISKIFLICPMIAFMSCGQNSSSDSNNSTSNTSTNTSQNTTIEKPKKDTVEKTSDAEYDFKYSNYKDVVPSGYKILLEKAGDINLDGVKDYVIILGKNNEEEAALNGEDNLPRPLLLVLGDKNGKYALARRNDKSVLCFDCGGAMGDPLSGIAIKNGYFSIEHYGGANYRWSRIVTYKYNKEEKEWYLHKDGTESFDAMDPDKVTSNIQTTKDFGKVKFVDFDIEK